MEYSGRNFGSDSMQPKHCKYVIGVVDKKSKIVTLHEAPTFAVKQVCFSPASWPCMKFRLPSLRVAQLILCLAKLACTYSDEEPLSCVSRIPFAIFTHTACEAHEVQHRA